MTSPFTNHNLSATLLCLYIVPKKKKNVFNITQFLYSEYEINKIYNIVIKKTTILL